MQKIELEQSPKEFFTSLPGLALVGLCLQHADALTRLLARLDRGRTFAIPSRDILTAFIGLLCSGKSDYEAIEDMREDAWFKEALSLRHVPSAVCLRQRLDDLARCDEADGVAGMAAEGAVGMLRRLRAPVTGYARKRGRLIPLDMDVFVLDNSGTRKEGVEWTYRKVDGLAPIAAYLGFEGWCLGVELRPGSRHAQKGFVSFLGAALRRARSLTDELLLVRLDGAHDAAETFCALHAARAVHYVVRWNPRGADLGKWLERALEEGVEESGHRDGVRSWLLESVEEREFGGERVRCRRVVRVTRVELNEHGQGLLVPQIHLEGWWTDLSDPAEEVIRLYRDHGGSEQFHSELKTDLDLERLPSKYFGTNALVLSLGGLAYNVLRLLGRKALSGGYGPRRALVKRRRARTVMQELVWGAARFIRHGRRLLLRFGRHCPRFAAFRHVFDWLWSMPASEPQGC